MHKYVGSFPDYVFYKSKHIAKLIINYVIL